MSANDHEGAVAALREGVLACRASDEWMNDEQMVFASVRLSIARWVEDLGRSLGRAAKAIEKARQHNGEPDEEMVEELEAALTQIGSARDKIVAVIALVFGVPSLVPQKPGMKFEPKGSAVKGVLSKLGAEGHAQAGQVKKQLDALDDHAALSLRHQIVHALSPLGKLDENCWFRRADLDQQGGIVQWGNWRLLPNGTLDHGDIKPATIWEWALRSAEEAIGLLVEATGALTKLIASVKEIAPPQPVYVWPDGRIAFERPGGDWLHRDLGSSTGSASVAVSLAVSDGAAATSAEAEYASPVSAVKLTVVGNEIEAEVLCGLLRSKGIGCGHRKSDIAAAINGGTGMGGPTEILVAAADLEAARQLLPPT